MALVSGLRTMLCRCVYLFLCINRRCNPTRDCNTALCVVGLWSLLRAASCRTRPNEAPPSGDRCASQWFYLARAPEPSSRPRAYIIISISSFSTQQQTTMRMRT